MIIANYIGGFFRWLLRGCRTRLDDELHCKNGWLDNIPILNIYENAILAMLFVAIVIVALFVFGIL